MNGTETGGLKLDREYQKENISVEDKGFLFGKIESEGV